MNDDVDQPVKLSTSDRALLSGFFGFMKSVGPLIDETLFYEALHHASELGKPRLAIADRRGFLVLLNICLSLGAGIQAKTKRAEQFLKLALSLFGPATLAPSVWLLYAQVLLSIMARSLGLPHESMLAALAIWSAAEPESPCAHTVPRPRKLAAPRAR